MSRRRLVLARLSTAAIFFAAGAGMGVWASYIPALKERFGLDDAALSLTLLGVALGAVLAMSSAGWLATRFGTRLVSVVAAVGLALVLAALPLAPVYALFIPMAAIMGACMGSMDVAMNAHAAAVEKEWGGAIMSSFHAFFSVGGLAGAAIAGFAIERGVGVDTGLPLAGGCIALLVLAAGLGLGRFGGGGEAGHALVLPRGAALGLGGLAALGFLSEGAMMDWTAVYLVSVVGAVGGAAVSGFAGFSLAMTAGRFLGDRVIRRFGRTAVLRGSGLLAGLGIAVAVALPGPIAAPVGFAIAGLGMSNIVPILFSAASALPGIPPAAGLGMVATMGYAAFLVGPPVIGLGAQAVGLRWALLPLVIACAAIALGARRRLASQA